MNFLPIRIYLYRPYGIFFIFIALIFFSCSQPIRTQDVQPESMTTHHKNFAQELRTRNLISSEKYDLLLNDLKEKKLASILDFLPYCKHAAVIDMHKIEHSTDNESQLVGEIVRQISLIHPMLSYSNFEGTFGDYDGYINYNGFSLEYSNKTYYNYASTGNKIPSIFNEFLMDNDSEYRVVVVYNDFSPYKVIDCTKDYRKFGVILVKMEEIKDLYYYSKYTEVFDCSAFPSLERPRKKYTHLLRAVPKGTYYSSLKEALKNPLDVNHLHLDSDNLTELGNEIGVFTNLRTLSLSHNQLTSLPPAISSLTKLERLNLYGNNFSELPTEITDLVHLQQLKLGGNSLKNLPSKIGNLTQLRTLQLENNQLATIPSSIENLQLLNYINLSNNKIDSLPTEFFNLKNLRQAILSDNALKYLNPEINQLKKLHQLTLDNNQLEILPNQLGTLYNLTYLDLRQNKLHCLPNNLNQLTSLEYLSFQHNFFLPKEETESVNTWFKKQKERLFWSRILVKE